MSSADRSPSPAIGAWGASLLGVQAESWRWAFYLVVPPGILAGALELLHARTAARPGRPGATGGSRRRSRWRDYLILLRTPSYVLCTLGMAAMTFAIGGIAFWMPYYLENRPGARGPHRRTFGAITVCGRLDRHAAGRLGGRQAARPVPRLLFPGLRRGDAGRLPAVPRRADTRLFPGFGC